MASRIFRWFSRPNEVLQPEKDVSGRITFNPNRPSNSCGTFCDIFIGKHGAFGKVAMKRPRVNHQTVSEADLKQFEEEADTWRQFKHKYILQFYGTYRQDGYVYMVSPWIKNGSLKEYIYNNPNTDRIRLLRETAEALVYLHGQSFLHGDIKSSNILVSDDVHVLLCDFGLSRMSTVATAAGLKGAGTIRWQSPELWQSAPKSEKSDVYAFGITIYEVLSGKMPYEELVDAAVYYKVSQDYRPPRSPKFSPVGQSYATIWNVAEKCWQGDPADRPTMADAFRQMHASVASRTPRAAQPSSSSSSRPSPGPSRNLRPPSIDAVGTNMQRMPAALIDDAAPLARTAMRTAQALLRPQSPTMGNKKPLHGRQSPRPPQPRDPKSLPAISIPKNLLMTTNTPSTTEPVAEGSMQRSNSVTYQRTPVIHHRSTASEGHATLQPGRIGSEATTPLSSGPSTPRSYAYVLRSPSPIIPKAGTDMIPGVIDIDDPPTVPRVIRFSSPNQPYYGFTNYSPHEILYQKKRYPTAEHLYQALKFMDHRPLLAEHIRTASPEPQVAFKEAGRFSPEVRKDWFSVNIDIMAMVLEAKFTQHRDLRKQLVDTGDAPLVYL
ncbi:hypothetical protein FRB99_008762 [Tulasnella sp. 403]|nr:hypothetical protein FRB99_008762 [Tulasnella sp. 403]